MASRLARYSGSGYKLYMNSSGYICFGIDDDSTFDPDDSACTTTSYADSTWHFVEAVKSGTSSITLYIDGVQQAQAQLTLLAFGYIPHQPLIILLTLMALPISGLMLLQ